MRHTQLVNYTLYQIGWFACVLGGASQRPWTGCLIAMILVGVHLALSVERSLEVRLVVLATAVGAVVEMIQIAAGTYRFTSGTVTRRAAAALAAGHVGAVCDDVSIQFAQCDHVAGACGAVWSGRRSNCVPRWRTAGWGHPAPTACGEPTPPFQSAGRSP